MAVTRATGSDSVLSLFSVLRKLAAMVLSASAVLKSPKAASEAPGAAKGLGCPGLPDVSSMPWLTADATPGVVSADALVA